MAAALSIAAVIGLLVYNFVPLSWGLWYTTYVLAVLFFIAGVKLQAELDDGGMNCEHR